MPLTVPTTVMIGLIQYILILLTILLVGITLAGKASLRKKVGMVLIAFGSVMFAFWIIVTGGSGLVISLFYGLLIIAGIISLYFSPKDVKN